MDPSTHQGSPSQRLPGSHDSNDNDHNQQHRVRFAEGEPQASYPIYQPTPKREPPHATTSLAAPPAVYWDNQKHGESDRESDANLAGYTFYREGTPPPPGYGGPEKRLGRGGGPAAPIGESSTVGGGTIRSDGDYSIGPLNPLDTNWDQNDRNSIPPAKRKNVRWAIIAAVVLVIIAIAVGLGVGLGVGLPKDKGAHADAAEQPSSPIPDPGPQNSPAPTDPPTTTPGGTGAAADATTGSAAAPRPTYNSDCPALNDTIYNVPGSTLSFRRLCGVDYSGSGATDLAHAYTDSMADCMNTCASFDQCTACAWGYLEGDHAGKHRCYMKKDLKKSHKAASDWCFAMVQ